MRRVKAGEIMVRGGNFPGRGLEAAFFVVTSEAAGFVAARQAGVLCLW